MNGLAVCIKIVRFHTSILCQYSQSDRNCTFLPARQISRPNDF